MKPRQFFITIMALLFLGSMRVDAQSNTQTFTPSHLQAAERMLKASGVGENIHKLFGQMITIQSKRLPEKDRVPFSDVMNRFMDKYASWEELKKAFIPIYASEFNENELNQIADFLLSPAGKIMTAKQPELVQKGSEWGMKIFKDHQAELEEMIKKAMPKD